MSKELVIRNGFLIHSNNTNYQVITGITNYAMYVATGNTLVENDYTLVTEKAIKRYVDSQIEQKAGAQGPLGTIQISDGNGDFTGYTGFKWLNANTTLYITGDTILSGNITGTSAYFTNLILNNTQSVNEITTNINGNIDNTTLATTSAITSYIAEQISQFTTTLSGLTDTTINNPQDGDILVYKTATQWTNTGQSYLFTTFDARYVNIDGDTMTGDLTLSSADLNINGGNLVLNGNANITGDLYVSGTTITMNVKDLNVADNIITINSGETNTGVTRLAAGIKVDRGAGIPYYFVWDEMTDTFRIGASNATETPNIVLSGDTQAVATREDSPIVNGIAYWNNIEYRFDTSNNFTWNSATTTLNVTGNITVSGNVDGVDISQFYSDYNTFTGTTNTLANLNDVTLSSLNPNDVLQYNGTKWINSQNLNLTGTLKVTGVTTLYDDLIVNGNITGVTTYLTNLNIGGVQVNEIATNITGNIDNSTLATTSAITTYVQNALYESGITITNNVNGYLLTAIGDNNTVNGNSGLTFNGTDLTISALAGTGNRLTYVDSTGRLQQTNEYVYKPNSVNNGTGLDTVDSFSSGLTNGCVWHYTVQSGSTNYRSGIITAVWGNGSIEMNETSTNDIGNTVDMDFTITLNSGNVILQSNITSGTWNIKVVRMLI